MYMLICARQMIIRGFFLLFSFLISLYSFACSLAGDLGELREKVIKEKFVAVTDITGAPSVATANTPLTLTATVTPDNATNKVIVWTVQNAGATGANITDGNTLHTTAAGTVIVRAAIINGADMKANFTKDFTITVNSGFVAVTNITDVPIGATAGKPLTLKGAVIPSNATNQTITWTVQDMGSTGANITDGNTLNTTTAGTVKVRATIVNGEGPAADFAKDFEITVGLIGIVGDPYVGVTLTVDINGLAGGGIISFQWVRNGTTVIGGNSSEYTIVVADIGSTITVTAERSGNNATSAPIGPVTWPPLTGTVSIDGIAYIGETLTANISNLGGSGTISYLWKRNETTIGSDSSAYVVHKDDDSCTITVTVTRVGYSNYAVSAPFGPISWPPLTGEISINGKAESGQSLTVNIDKLNGSGDIFYQWKRSRTYNIGTGSTYLVQSIDVGSIITVTVECSQNIGSITSDPLLHEINYGDFYVAGIDLHDISCVDNILNIPGDGVYTIGMRYGVTSTSTDRIVIASKVNADVILSGVNIDVSSMSGVYAFDMTGATVTLTLVGENVLRSGSTMAGLQVPNGSTLIIAESSGGSLSVSSSSGAGIGSDGNITINGGTVSASGSSGINGTITINGGTVSATHSAAASGSGISGTITINGGKVSAIGSQISPGISGTIRAIIGNAVVSASNQGVHNSPSPIQSTLPTGSNLGPAIIFIYDNGTVYGNVTLDRNIIISTNGVLVIADGQTLTIQNGNTLTNNGSIIVEKGGNIFGTVTGNQPFNFTTATTEIFNENFEEPTHSFTIENGTQTNQWYVGTTVAAEGAKSVYISNDGGISNAYTNSTSSRVHLYRDVTFPASTEPFLLIFQLQSIFYRGNHLVVQLTETSTIPIAGSSIGGTVLNTYSISSNWNQKKYIVIPVTNSGTTKRLVFTWYNATDSYSILRPAAIDNIVLWK